jgi:hypothetical protein
MRSFIFSKKEREMPTTIVLSEPPAIVIEGDDFLYGLDCLATLAPEQLLITLKCMTPAQKETFQKILERMTQQAESCFPNESNLRH